MALRPPDPLLVVRVYCLPAQLVLIGSSLPSDGTMFAFAVCLGKSLLSPARPGPATVTDTKFRGCLPLPGVLHHLPVGAHQSQLETVNELKSYCFIYLFILPLLSPKGITVAWANS